MDRERDVEGVDVMIGEKFDSFSGKLDNFDLANIWYNDLYEEVDAMIVAMSLADANGDSYYVSKLRGFSFQITKRYNVGLINPILLVRVKESFEEPPIVEMEVGMFRKKTASFTTYDAALEYIKKELLEWSLVGEHRGN